MTTIQRLMEMSKITEQEMVDARDTEGKFVSHSINGRAVHVEIMAPNIADVLLGLSTANQLKLFTAMLNLVPNVGDQDVITDDRGDKKSRAARVIRTRCESPEGIGLLITR